MFLAGPQETKFGCNTTFSFFCVHWKCEIVACYIAVFSMFHADTSVYAETPRQEVDDALSENVGQ